MYQTLPTGVKISISHSIKKAFKLYMESIEWDDDKYNSEEFILYWNDYSRNHTSWIKSVDPELFNNPTFQKELLEKVNEMIKNLIETEPTKKQIERIDSLVTDLGMEDVSYCCKAEADYHIEKLTKQLQERAM